LYDYLNALSLFNLIIYYYSIKGQNGATCYILSGVNVLCTCPTGFSGTLCEVYIGTSTTTTVTTATTTTTTPPPIVTCPATFTLCKYFIQF
jgi:hypothetical protein